MEQLAKFNVIFMVFAIIILVIGFFYFYSPEEPKEKIKAEEPKQVIAVEEIAEEKPAEKIAEEPAGGIAAEEKAGEVKPKEVIIEIKWKSFEPTGDVTVEKGATVTWKNTDTESPAKEHLISSKYWVFKSEKLSPGDTFSYTFNDLGVYEYIDSIYGINGKITVVEKKAAPITGNVIAGNAVDIGAKSSGILAALLVLVVVYVCFGIYRKKSS